MSMSPTGRPRPFVLIIMDGWGINTRKEGNAIALARTPNLDKLAKNWPHTTIRTSGEAVGLPEGQMGNSEVGHQNIGAGKRVLQDYTRVNESIRDGSFYQNPALLKAIEHVKKNSSQQIGRASVGKECRSRRSQYSATKKNAQADEE